MPDDPTLHAMTRLERTTPLGAAAAARHAAPGFELRERPFVPQIRVQTLRADADRFAALAGESLPTTPNRALGDDPWFLWRAPGDWLAYSLDLTAERLAAAVDVALDAARGMPAAGPPLLTTDVSPMYAVFDVAGERAIDVLLRDVTLDLEGDALAPGTCAQTVLAQMSVLLHRPAPADLWRLWVDRSAARQLWDWLVDSAELTTPAATGERFGAPW